MLSCTRSQKKLAVFLVAMVIVEVYLITGIIDREHVDAAQAAIEKVADAQTTTNMDMRSTVETQLVGSAHVRAVYNTTVHSGNGTKSAFLYKVRYFN
jgi:hypothetical protein